MGLAVPLVVTGPGHTKVLEGGNCLTKNLVLGGVIGGGKQECGTTGVLEGGNCLTKNLVLGGVIGGGKQERGTTGSAAALASRARLCPMPTSARTTPTPVPAQTGRESEGVGCAHFSDPEASGQRQLRRGSPDGLLHRLCALGRVTRPLCAASFVEGCNSDLARSPGVLSPSKVFRTSKPLSSRKAPVLGPDRGVAASGRVPAAAPCWDPALPRCSSQTGSPGSGTAGLFRNKVTNDEHRAQARHSRGVPRGPGSGRSSGASRGRCGLINPWLGPAPGALRLAKPGADAGSRRFGDS
ncbi:PREDICTED: LOW QUALITY PROTEIN: uncharacterized protein LOC105532600 [Mandrillus leucophaeus]|uniref:LOW QUALITY PROTEIN: uncharacterized protein LOC105532600 n=1 Tax=Mandrillus leucophaeus TaxID=9568 RepID=UPI0005F3E49C|nr:PREDICTED: LOW QUALITY PROTEIN: uncharacterized protein LOC105532600 [Mandrillus leucophaeus]